VTAGVAIARATVEALLAELPKICPVCDDGVADVDLVPVQIGEWPDGEPILGSEESPVPCEYCGRLADAIRARLLAEPEAPR